MGREHCALYKRERSSLESPRSSPRRPYISVSLSKHGDVSAQLSDPSGLDALPSAQIRKNHDFTGLLRTLPSRLHLNRCMRGRLSLVLQAGQGDTRAVVAFPPPSDSPLIHRAPGAVFLCPFPDHAACICLCRQQIRGASCPLALSQPLFRLKGLVLLLPFLCSRPGWMWARLRPRP